MQHYTRFREIERVLAPFATGNLPAYLQNVTKASKVAGKEVRVTELERAAEASHPKANN